MNSKTAAEIAADILIALINAKPAAGASHPGAVPAVSVHEAKAAADAYTLIVQAVRSQGLT